MVLCLVHSVAPQVSPLEFLNITVSRTHQNSGLVVQWNVTHPPLPGTVITHYRVQYRTIDGVDGGGGVNEEGYIVQVDASQGWILVNELEDAQGYEVYTYVCIHVYVFNMLNIFRVSPRPSPHARNDLEDLG